MKPNVIFSAFFLATFSKPSITQAFSLKPIIQPQTRRTSKINALSAATLESPTTTLPQTEHEYAIPYNWKDQWYALTYAAFIPNPSESAEPISAAAFGNPLVLWKSEDDGPIICADDICPHRSAALSEGRVRDGRIECLYHGWQFRGVEGEGDPSMAGSCARIPQLKVGGTIPKRACVKMHEVRVVDGIVWTWMGDSAPSFDPPSTGLDISVDGKKKGWNVYQFQIDLPYDHSYLVENLLDPAHIPISHDRTGGGGTRADAQPYEMIVDQDSIGPRGFTGRFRKAGANADPDGQFIELEFEAPGIVRQSLAAPTFQFAAALHCMPLGLGRSRLLFMVMNSGLPWFVNLILNAKPLWLRHLHSCKVLEQDVGLITTQEDHFARNPGRELQDDFLMLTTSDKFILEYRRWLDRVGHGMPWFQGLASSRDANGHLAASNLLNPAIDRATHRASNEEVSETRYHRHVVHSPVTRRALKNLKKTKAALIAGAIAAAGTAVGLIPLTTTPIGGAGSSIRVVRTLLKILGPSIPLFALGAAGVHNLEQHFYSSFKRKEELRTQRGDDKF